MGYNRGGARRTARLKRARREQERLARKAQIQTITGRAAVGAGEAVPKAAEAGSGRSDQ
jgi:hypothetical protein